jgi:hypothetical protein
MVNFLTLLISGSLKNKTCSTRIGPKRPILGEVTLFGFDPSRCPKPKQNHMENQGPTKDKDFYMLQGSEKCCFVTRTSQSSTFSLKGTFTCNLELHTSCIKSSLASWYSSSFWELASRVLQGSQIYNYVGCSSYLLVDLVT